jgi:hypothetical protein
MRPSKEGPLNFEPHSDTFEPGAHEDIRLPSKPRRSRWIAIAGGIVAVVALLAILGAVGLMIRLSSGPIRFDELGHRIAAALDSRAGDRYKFTLGTTSIAKSPHGLTLLVDQFAVRVGDQTIVEAPHAEVSLDPLALMVGEVRPRRLDVTNMDVNLVVLPDGSVSIASGQNAAPISVTPAAAPPAAAPGKGDPPRAALLAQAGVALTRFFDFTTSSTGVIGLLERVGIRSGRLIVDDRTAGRKTTFEDLGLVLEKSRGATNLELSARGHNGPINISARAAGTPQQTRTLDIDAKGVTIDELILAGGIRHPNIDSDMKIATGLHVTLDPDGRVHEARAQFDLGVGYVRLDDPDHEPFFIDELSGGLHWDAAARRFVIDPVQLFASETRLVFKGRIDPPAQGREDWRIVLGLGAPGTLSPERPGESILQVTEMGAEIDVLPFSQRATFDHAVIRGPEVDVAFDGSLDWSQGVHLKFAGTSGQGPLRALMRVWPSHVAATLRGWLIGHTHGGTVRQATMSANFDSHALLMMRYGLPPPDGTLAMDFTVANGSVDTLPGVGPVTGLEAVAHVTGRTMQMKASSGTLDVSPGRKLTLTEGTLRMPRNDGAGAVPAILSVHTGGPAEAIAELLTRDALKSYAQLPIEPSAVHGKIDGKFTADFEVGPDAKGADTKVEVSATATDFGIDHIVGKEKLEGATLSITSDSSGTKIAGNGRIFGGPGTFELRKPPGAPAVATINVAIDDAGRARTGFALPGVTGPIGAKISATFGDAVRALVDLDLTRAGLENGIPGLVKPAGKPARLTFAVDQRPSGVLLDQLSFEGAGALARGVVELAPDGGFQSARLSQMQLSPGDDFHADMARSADGIKISVRGAAIDARPFLKFVTKPGAAAGTGGDFDLDLKVPIVTGAGKQVLSNVDLKIARKSAVIRQFAMTAAFGRSPVVIQMQRSESNVPQVSVTTTDAGALLAFTDLYVHMEGGGLSALMQIDPGRVTGTLKVQQFVIKDEPAMRRLVAEGVPHDPAQTGGKPIQRPDANQIAFDRLQVVFSHSNGRLDVRDGLMSGALVGLTVQGSIDDGRDTLDLSGTFVPAYGINNLFAKIPVVGLFLGGGWDEGLFALNYHITGRPSAPVLSVNPLSAVAPGFLRKLFGAFDGSAQPGFAPGGFDSGTGAVRRVPAPSSQNPGGPSGR